MEPIEATGSQEPGDGLSAPFNENATKPAMSETCAARRCPVVIVVPNATLSAAQCGPSG